MKITVHAAVSLALLRYKASKSIMISSPPKMQDPETWCKLTKRLCDIPCLPRFDKIEIKKVQKSDYISNRYKSTINQCISVF